MTRDFDDNEIPLAYLITFRCYGTWLHGDERGSMDRKRNGAVARPCGRARLTADSAMSRDFDDNEIPLAYLITFRCYGTWLHGDERGSMDRKRNKYGAARIQPNIRLKTAETALLKSQPLVLDAGQRIVVER